MLRQIHDKKGSSAYNQPKYMTNRKSMISGSSFFLYERLEESDRGVCAHVLGIQRKTSEKSVRI